MLKVAVLDSGWGGELVADLIEEELGVVEVVRVIDWRNAPYAERDRGELVALAEEALRPYWGRVDAVVLGGWVISSVREELAKRHPQEKWVGFELTEINARINLRKKALLLADIEMCNEEKKWGLEKWLRSQGIEMVVESCRNWTRLIDDGEMTEVELKRRLAEMAELGQADMILLGNTHLWDIREDLQKALDWRVMIYDWRDELLRDVCSALRLRGLDGKRSK